MQLFEQHIHLIIKPCLVLVRGLFPHKAVAVRLSLYFCAVHKKVGKIYLSILAKILDQLIKQMLRHIALQPMLYELPKSIMVRRRLTA